jgi:hypothetical protein
VGRRSLLRFSCPITRTFPCSQHTVPKNETQSPNRMYSPHHREFRRCDSTAKTSRLQYKIHVPGWGENILWHRDVEVIIQHAYIGCVLSCVYLLLRDCGFYHGMVWSSLHELVACTNFFTITAQLCDHSGFLYCTRKHRSLCDPRSLPVRPEFTRLPVSEFTFTVPTPCLYRSTPPCPFFNAVISCTLSTRMP